MSANRIDLLFEPVDTWFFRDARPMQAGAGSGGHGARWPLPTTLYAAVRTALLDAAGHLPAGKTEPVLRHRKGGVVEARVGTTRFDHVRLWGGLPWAGGKLYFPTPLDLAPVATSAAGGWGCLPRGPLAGAAGATNLPAPWLHAVGAYVAPSKEALPSWVPYDFLERYLRGDGAPWPIPEEVRLWVSEHRFGIQISPETRTVVERAFYAAEHLRLAEGVGLWAALAAGEAPELDAVAAAWRRGTLLTLGGEGRLARVRSLTGLDLPALQVRGTRIKWVLATPAVFAGGWRPGWVAEEDGRVKLKDVPARQPGESRGDWRARVREAKEIGARLVAVCAGKPVAFSGWDLLGKGGAEAGAGAPRTTRLAVPAGSVYYFEADDEEQARALAAALHGSCHSDELGEKGLGWGLCGTWDWLEPFWEV
ncbi:MAG: hypothetical protein Kow00109_22540 [Acidobacteriota bacterium]